jgi:MATE family multidrug resistance protein
VFRLLKSSGLLTRALKIGIPVAAANLVVAATLMIELLIVGNEVGSNAVGAVHLAATLTLVLVLAFHSIEIAGQAIVARRFGEQNYKATGACLDNALLLSGVFGLAITICLFALGPQVFFAKDPEVTSLAFEYFRWRLPSIPMLIAVLAMIGFLNGIGKPKVPLAIYATVLLMHLFLVYGLVGGHFGFPRLEVRGAGLASTISTATGMVTFLFYLARPKMRKMYGVFNFRANLDKKIFVSLVTLGSPIFLQQLLGNASIFLFQTINSRVDDGGISLDASAIGLAFANIATLPGFGFGIAAATMAGQYLGAKKPARAELAIKTCWLLGAIYMCSLGVLYMIFGESITRQFFIRTQETGLADPAYLEAVSMMGRKVFLVLGMYQVFDSMNTILGKALQGVGLSRFVLVANGMSQWLVFLPLAAFLTAKTPLGGLGSWIAMGIYLGLNAVMFARKFVGGEWKNTIV